MSINSTLRREGIEIINPLSTLEINKIASKIAEKLCSTFPEHNLNQSDLFISISRLNMYIAKMPNDMAVAKYFYKNDSIYFSENMDFDDLNTLAVHECIHFLQAVKDKRGKVTKLGLYNLQGKTSGMALNEAAVQYMASKANQNETDNVRYYNMNLTTESPDYYPLETAIIRQLAYFTGTYPLFHSVLYSNDVFKNTFIAKSNAKAYNIIESNLDLLMHYQEELVISMNNLDYCSENDASLNKIKNLSNRIEALKSIILKLTLEIQNTIIDNCFNKEFQYIKDQDSLNAFQSHLYNFKDLLIDTEGYNFYNEFYRNMMNKLEEKRELVKKYGVLTFFEESNKDLALFENPTYGIEFFKKLFNKLKLLFEEKIRVKNID
ncbi:MAG: hypothetical protein K1W33_02000 [Clostridia bacterium]|nr:hypothetical protein [Clostridia bacterium]